MTHKKGYSLDTTFIDKKGNRINPREHYKSRKPAVGEAYAFFDCDASEDDLKKVMLGIEKDPETPKGLELTVQEGTSGLELDERLVEAMQCPGDYRIMTHEMFEKEPKKKEAPTSSLKYSLVVKCPGLSNQKTAERTGNVLDYVRTLNENPDLFNCALVYEEKGEYILVR